MISGSPEFRCYMRVDPGAKPTSESICSGLIHRTVVPNSYKALPAGKFGISRSRSAYLFTQRTLRAEQRELGEEERQLLLGCGNVRK